MPHSTPPRSTVRPLLRILALLVAVLAATADASDAFVITSASVTRHPTKGDSFTIKGEFPDVAVVDASQVVFALDRSRSELQPSEMKHGKLKLTFTGARGAPGLTKLTLDLKKHIFTAKGAGLLLGGLPKGLTVHLEADDAGDGCAFVPLEQTTKPPKPGARPKPIRFRLPRKVASMPCVSNGIVHIVPPAVVAGPSTSVRFMAPSVATGTTDLRLFAATPGGAPTGSPLCTLADDGGPSSGDVLAGDQTFTCTVTVAEATLGASDFVVTGVRAGVSLTSPVVELRVVAAPSDADVATMLDAQAAARAIWEEEVVALGDTLSARLATIRRIAALAGVADVGLSPDGVDIFIVYDSGHEGGLMLSPRGGTIETTTAAAATNVGAAIRQDASAAVPDDAGEPSVHPRNLTFTCPATPPRALVGTPQALMLSTSFFGSADDGPLAKAKLEKLPCLDIHVDTKQLTIPNLLALGGYSTVIISTHGLVAANGGPGMATDETATLSQFYEGGVYHAYFVADEAAIVSVPKTTTAEGREVVYVTPQFLEHIPGQMDHALVYASHCHSGDDDSEASEFIAKGAETVFGYLRTTSYNFSRLTARSLFDDMAVKFFTSGQAYGRAIKVDPTPFHPDEIPAVLRIFGNHQLSYVGLPKLLPASSTIETGQTADLTTTVDRAESCELTYDWSTTANAGKLDDDKGGDGDSFTSTAPAVTYETHPSGVGDDGIHVAVHAPDDDGAEGPVFGEACSVVDVEGCGDDVVQPGEDCDGTDDAACPGHCTASCVCPSHTIHITFVGRGKWTLSINGITFTASETWTNHYDFDLFGGTGFPESPGPGTTVDGTSSIVGMNATDPCTGGLVVNRSHGQATAPTPLFWEIGGQPPLFVFDTFGGYDYRLCDGEMNALVGNFSAVPNGYPTYSPAIGFATVPYVLADWFNVPAHAQTFSGLGMSEVAPPAPDLSATACWTGTIQLSTDANAEPPSLDDVPAPGCL